MKRHQRVRSVKAIFIQFITLIVCICCVLFFVFRYGLNISKVNAEWMNDNWRYRILLTIDHTKVAADQTDFPVYVDLSLLPAQFHQNVNQTDGRDIRVTKADGITELPREVVYYDASTRRGELHVKYTGTLSSLTNTPFYIYYGNPSASDYAASDTYGKYNVWSSNYTSVWHFSESSGNHTDSKGANNSSSISVTQQGANIGKLGKADEYNGSDNAVVVSDADTLSYSGDFTIEAWVKFDQLAVAKGDNNTFLSKRNTSGPSIEYALSQVNSGGNNYIMFQVESNELGWYDATYTGAITTGTWYHVVGTKTSNVLKIYVDTSDTTGNTFSGTTFNSDENLYIGNYGSSAYTDGVIDEIRLSSSARSSTWISTQYNNQNSPATFFTTGSEERRRATILSMSFDEGSGTTAHDASPNHFNGTLSGATTPTWQTEDACIAGKCLFYNGTTAYTNIASSVANVQTVSFWVRPKTNSETLIDFDGGTHYLSAASGTITATGFDSPTIYVNGVSGGSLVANAWQHIEVTTATAFTASNITIGKQSSTYFTGFIDEFSLFDYARSATQVKMDYNARGNSPIGAAALMGGSNVAGGSLSNGLVGYWKMDENTGSNANDSSFRSHTCNTFTGVGGRKWDNGKFNGGFAGDIFCGDINELDNVAKFTYSAWYNIPTQTDWQVLMDKSLDTTHMIRIQEGSVANPGKLYFYLGNGANTYGMAGTLFTAGQWFHVDMVYDGTGSADADKLKVYINGQPIRLTFSGPIPATTADQLTNQLTMGTTTAIIDEARVYNRALSPAEVQWLYAWAPGPVSWWKMDENTGTTANDSSGNGNNSTAWTGATWAVGKFGSATSYNGSDQVVRFAETPSTDLGATTDSYTMNAWINFNSCSTTCDIVTKMTNSSSAYPFHMYIDSAKMPYFSIRDSSGNVSTAFLNSAISSNTWYFLSAVRDVARDTVSLYVNGTLALSSQTATDITTDSAVNNDDISIGNGGNSYTNNDFNGKIDDVRFYNYARTPSQIIEDMNAGHPAPGSPIGSAIGYWKFDEGHDATANNSGSGGSTYDGTITGATWNNNGKFGKALDFNDSTGYIGFSTQPMNWSSRNRTISMWVQPDSSDLTGFHALLVGYDTDYTYSRMRLRYSSGRLNFNYAIYPGPTYANITSNTTLVAGNWYHVVVTWDDLNYYLYINGSQESVYSDSSTTTDHVTLTTIGSNQDTDEPDTYIYGLIDEVKFYNAALTADEVKLDYNHGSSLVLGSLSDSSNLSGGSTASNSASAAYCVPGSSDPCAPPVGEWKLDENTGITANDTSGNGNAGTLTNGPVWKTGKVGSALAFSGVNDSVIIDGSRVYATKNAPFSASAWVKLTDFSVSSYPVIVRLRSDDTEPWFMLLSDWSGLLGLSIGNAGTFKSIRTDTPSSSLTGVWHHIAVTYNGAGSSTMSNFSLYIDGQLQTNIAGGSYVTNPQATSISYAKSGNRWHGLIDDVRIYDYARTPAQVAWEYNRGAPLFWYKFDECQGTVAYNSALGANGTPVGINGTISIGGSGTYTAPGTCTGAATDAWTGGVSGKYGASLGFDGSNDYVYTADSATIKNMTNISVAAWVYSDTQAGVYDEAVTDFGINGTSGKFWLATVNASHRMEFGISPTSCSRSYASQIIAATPNGSIPTSQWLHLVGTYDGSNVKIYLNGQLKATTPYTGGMSTACGGSINIGALNLDPQESFWDGKIDDVHIYNYALTQQQVNMVMNGAAVRFGQ